MSRLQHFAILELMILEKALDLYQDHNNSLFDADEKAEPSVANSEPFDNVSRNLHREIRNEVSRQTAWVDPYAEGD